MMDFDRSTWNKQPLETLQHCPICRSAKLETVLPVPDHFLSRKVFTLTECKACGFRITNPRPPQSQIGGYYKSVDYISHTARRSGLVDHMYHWVRVHAIRGKHRLIQQYQAQGRVLDIGCGTGDFLHYLQGKGYLVQGVEPDLGAREKAIADHGLRVVSTTDAIPQREHFQVITLWHVMEHVPDPRATFKQLFALLADRGLLVIAVPDRGSWDTQHYGSHWAAWDVPRHLSHFRRQDIHRLLHEHGFELIATRPMWFDSFYICLLSEKYKGRRAIFAWPTALIKGAWSNLLALISSRPTSSSLFIARKVEP